MITNPEAVRFSNEVIRPAADVAAQYYYFCKALIASYAAKGLDKEYTDADVVDDGSDKDGRHPITGFDVKAIVQLAADYVNDFETGVNAKLNSVLAVAVNPQRP